MAPGPGRGAGARGLGLPPRGRAGLPRAGAGETERARAELAVLQAEAERVGRPWPLAVAARCAGLLAVDDELDARFARAYELHRDVPSPLELARSELCHGERLRRARRPREARGRLRSALGTFEALGAAPWAARVRSELRAAGGAVPPAHEPLSRRLTAQELEVALLVARGASNREAAAALFVSPKTVEAHLGRIFRKLDLRSRTQRAALMAERGVPDPDATDLRRVPDDHLHEHQHEQDDDDWAREESRM